MLLDGAKRLLKECALDSEDFSAHIREITTARCRVVKISEDGVARIAESFEKVYVCRAAGPEPRIGETYHADVIPLHVSDYSFFATTLSPMPLCQGEGWATQTKRRARRAKA